MAVTDQDRTLKSEFEPLVEQLGFRIVELHSATVHGRVHLDLVIYRREGVSIDDCAEVHKLVRPRAELLLDDRDVAVQVASPGIDRVLKDHSEFAIFVGNPVRILPINDADWVAGVIEKADEESVTISTPDGPATIRFDEVQKAKLE